MDEDWPQGTILLIDGTAAMALHGGSLGVWQYRAVSAGEAAGFVGRTDELRGLSLRLERVLAGGGGVVVVAGGAGVGKTRLVEELAALAVPAGVTVAWATCWESGEGEPYGPWWQVLAQLAVTIDVSPIVDLTPEVARARLFAGEQDGRAICVDCNSAKADDLFA